MGGIISTSNLKKQSAHCLLLELLQDDAEINGNLSPCLPGSLHLKTREAYKAIPVPGPTLPSLCTLPHPNPTGCGSWFVILKRSPGDANRQAAEHHQNL